MSLKIALILGVEQKLWVVENEVMSKPSDEWIKGKRMEKLLSKELRKLYSSLHTVRAIN
jgi:hypothetical protein